MSCEVNQLMYNREIIFFFINMGNKTFDQQSTNPHIKILASSKRNNELVRI
jgi:hypothetical protein